MRLRSYAKVNLALSVGPPIPAGQANAGYHPIASWMHAIDLFDEIEFEVIGADKVSSYTRLWANGTPCEWPEDADLAVRAHRLFEQEIGRAIPIYYEITKRIPAGGGLGGGSSNAATVLVALNAITARCVPYSRLVELSRELGSDVAFFLDGAIASTVAPPRPAFVSGLGDRIERTPRREGCLVLILPNFGCQTREVYKAYDQSPRPLREREVRELAQSAAASLGMWEPMNDLYQPACRVRPELAELARTIEQASGQRVHMSGSGSTLFVPSIDKEAAAPLVDRVQHALGTRARVVPVRLV